jgi:hypothetical protein
MKTLSFKCALVATLLLAAGAFSARAQSYSIDWSTIDGGGSTSTGGVYSVSGTIGQPDAGGSMTGGNYSLTGGFWSIFAVQTPGAPLLTVTLAGANTIVSWPSPSIGFVLQENPDVANTNGWSNYDGIANSNVTTLSVIVPANAGNKYFRLKK